MKKLLLSLFFIILLSKAFAQTNTVGGELGFNVSTLNASRGKTAAIQTGNAIGTYNLGFVDNVSFGNFAIFTGAWVSGNGGKFVEDGTEKILRINYLKIPVDFTYQQNKGKSGFYIGAGPYFSGGLGGKYKEYNTVNRHYKSFNRFKKDSPYRIADIGGEGVLGYRLKSGLNFNIDYDQGVANIITDRFNDNGNKSLTTRSVGVTVGIFFE
jgi:hypothetical protein